MDADDGPVLEPLTSIKFPPVVCGGVCMRHVNDCRCSSDAPTPQATERLCLAGVSVREKKIGFVNIRAYALGVYVMSGSETLLQYMPEADTPNRQHDIDSGLFATLNTDDSVAKAFRLVTARHIPSGRMKSSLGETISPRVERSFEGRDGLAPVMKQLHSMLDFVAGTKGLDEGTVIWFVLKENCTVLHVRLHNDDELEIASPEMCGAVSDTFLGAKSVVPQLRPSILKRFPLLLETIASVTQSARASSAAISVPTEGESLVADGADEGVYGTCLDFEGGMEFVCNHEELQRSDSPEESLHEFLSAEGSDADSRADDFVEFGDFDENDLQTLVDSLHLPDERAQRGELTAEALSKREHPKKLSDVSAAEGSGSGMSARSSAPSLTHPPSHEGKLLKLRAARKSILRKNEAFFDLVGPISGKSYFSKWDMIYLRWHESKPLTLNLFQYDEKRNAVVGPCEKLDLRGCSVQRAQSGIRTPFSGKQIFAKKSEEEPLVAFGITSSARQPLFFKGASTDVSVWMSLLTQALYSPEGLQA